MNSQLRSYISQHRWAITFAIVGLLVVIRNLSGLSSSPPGLYNDEASIGYNAWTIAHTGLDEHGNPSPLFFQAFGEYKNPIYIYVLSFFLHWLPLTPAVVRLPAALFGLVAIAAVAGVAWKLTQSRAITLVALVLAGLTPWLTIESRLGFETISMVALFAVALWCLVNAGPERPLWYAGAGIALALAIYAYTTARVEVAVIEVVLIVVYGVHRRKYGAWWWTLPPILLAYYELFIWGSANPGALTGRFNSISIGFDHPSFVVLVERFVDNYFQYLGFPFLFTHGDPNLRQSSGFGGMLLVTSFPLVALGVVTCIRRFREPLPLLCLLVTLAGPAAAAATWDGTPHSLRAATMLPFGLVVMVFGAQEAFRLLAKHRAVLIGLAAAIVLEGAGYTWDLFVDYPQRAAAWFDTGQTQAIAIAKQDAGNHQVLISKSLDQPYIYVLFDLAPTPPPTSDTDQAATLAAYGFQIVDPNALGDAQVGDMLVLGPTDVAPAGASLVNQQFPPGARTDSYGHAQQPLIQVYRVTSHQPL